MAMKTAKTMTAVAPEREEPEDEEEKATKAAIRAMGTAN